MVVEQTVDPSVSRAKFAREVASFRALGPDYRRRGIWLLESRFPEVLLAFVGVKVNPPVVVFAARIDFTNYDLMPPSVTIVNALTGHPYRAMELPTQMLRRIETRATAPGPNGTGTQTVVSAGVIPMLQAHQPTDVPFLCLPGIREYHDHPAHTGDSWLLHRGRGAGGLAFIAEQLSKYGSESIHAYACQVIATGVGLHVPIEAVPL